MNQFFKNILDVTMICSMYLGHVHMIIGVNRMLSAHRSPQQLDGSVTDDFIYVHICLGSWACLPHN